MSEIEQIKTKIADTEAKLKKAEDEGKESLILAYSANLTSLNNLLAEQQKEKNILLSQQQGKFPSFDFIRCSHLEIGQVY